MDSAEHNYERRRSAAHRWTGSREERTRRRALILVAKAYSSISLDDASRFLGIPKLELADVVSSLGWSIDATNGMVLPTYTAVRHEDSMPSEEQLAKLTDFVAFLEN
ncbi:hypothetical protein HPB51_027337 [Rhipicephalus microplus]|uniref:CSN8/PSMD8/EIF3K domain-containing protein n=1 Tax=Rhipicephalus microplus TaxID=6941 RepID=A0A9J6D0F5_RHIMP|nr:hypothetical protein HPB51_027337 [Rhipicephalus microplus]